MSVTITLRGRHYTVRSDEPEDDVVQVAHWVDERVADIGRRTPAVDGETVALLACLNIASEYHRFQKRVATELSAVDQELAAVTAILEVACPTDDDIPELELGEE